MLKTLHMKFFRRDKRLEAVLNVCIFDGCGIYKRLDENRELMQLLLNQTPELFENFGRIKGWLKTQDEFFLAIIKALEIPHPYAGMAADNGRFPRPWPTENIPKEEVEKWLKASSQS